MGTYANLEWMGDISWNLGCIMLSENNCHSVDVFSEIPFSAPISKAVPVEGKSTDMKSNQSRMARDIVSTGALVEPYLLLT